MRWLFGLFLVAHGLIHVAIWLTPARSDAPFDVRHSPLLGDLGAIATTGGLLVGATFVVSGIAYLLDASWWPVALGVVALRSVGGN